ncbi:transglutaminase-like domain-containing protein [Caulobacter segnis]
MLHPLRSGRADPVETLQKHSGACRDLAWLMVEGLRRLGYAALSRHRLYPLARQPDPWGRRDPRLVREVFLPDLGWLEFDPTNGLAESPDLIRVAATRTPAQALPVSGAIIGDPGSFAPSRLRGRAFGQ